MFDIDPRQTRWLHNPHSTREPVAQLRFRVGGGGVPVQLHGTPDELRALRAKLDELLAAEPLQGRKPKPTPDVIRRRRT